MNRENGNPIVDGPIHVRLVSGDALARPADLAIVGSGKKLLDRIARESGSVFSPLEYPDWMQRKYGGQLDGIRTSRFLSSPDFVWRNVVSIRARPSASLRTRFQTEFLEAMVVSIRHIVRPKKVLFVPYHAQPPELVVMNTLCMIYFMMRMPLGRRTFFRPHEIEIVDVHDGGSFHRILSDVMNSGALTEFVKRQAERFLVITEREIDARPPEFTFEHFRPG